jgi:Ca2+-binding RTX toxin-like protein
VTNNDGVVSDYTCTGVTSLTANGGSLGDFLSAQGDTGDVPADLPIADIATRLNGGDGNDFLGVGNAGATLNGGNGDANLQGGPGNDVLNGGAGNDFLTGDNTDQFQRPSGTPPADADVLNGGDGTNTLNPSNGPNQVSGGAGVDDVSYNDNIENAAATAIVATPVSISLDGLANDGYASNNSNIAKDVEDVSVFDGQNCVNGKSRCRAPTGTRPSLATAGPTPWRAVPVTTRSPVAAAGTSCRATSATTR